MTIHEAQIDHLEKNWPSHKKESFTWDLGPIKQALPNFSVIRITPKSSDEPWVYLSHGAREINKNHHDCREFFILAPSESPRHIETLAMLVNFHASENNFLTIGACVNIGRGWLEGSNLDHLLISIPYPFGPKLEKCHFDGGNIIKYLWLLPVNQAEKEYLNQLGLEALESKFDENAIDYLDPNRSSVI